MGQRTLLAIQREERRLPEIGEVYRLLNERTDDEQYVRITSVEGSVETFTYAVSSDSYIDFERRCLQLGISAPLKVSFPGSIATPGGPLGQNGEQPSRIQTIQVADAARDYGLQTLKESAQFTNRSGASLGDTQHCRGQLHRCWRRDVPTPQRHPLV